MPASQPLRIFVAMPGTTMGEGVWDNIPEIKSGLLDPVRQQISERLSRPAELIIEKDKLSIEPIHRSMFREAYDADVYIADLTGANANVYLELGVRWALRDGVTIPISQDVGQVKFNVSSTRVIPYGIGPNALRLAINQIVEAAVHGIQNPGTVDNPVRSGSPTVAIERSRLDGLNAEIERLKSERADDLVSAAAGAEPQFAISLLRQALERNPYNFDAHFRLGVLLRKAGNYEAATDALRNGLNIQSNNAECWRELAVAQSLAGKLDDAEYSAQRSLQINPDNKETHSNLGGVYRRRARGLPSAQRHEKLEQAKASYLRAHQLDRNDTYSLINIALIDLWLASGSSDAEATLKKLELLTRLETMNNPSDPWKQFDLTTTLALLGRASDAVAAAHDAIGLVPPGQIDTHLISAIAPLRDSLGSSLIEEQQRDAIARVIEVFESARTNQSL
jgi:tetratricopeptide (TPR) repeat protein